MSILSKLFGFGKSKIEKESKTGIKIRSTVTPETPRLIPMDEFIEKELSGMRRNAKGQFIKDEPNPYIERDTATGQYKKKKPNPTEGDKDVSINIDYKKV